MDKITTIESFKEWCEKNVFEIYENAEVLPSWFNSSHSEFWYEVPPLVEFEIETSLGTKIMVYGECIGKRNCKITNIKL